MKNIFQLGVLFLVAGMASAVNAAECSVSIAPGVSLPVSGVWASDASDGGYYDYGRSGSFSTAIAGDCKVNSTVALGMEIGRNWAHSPQMLYNIDGGDTHIWQVTPYAKVLVKTGKFTPYGIIGAGLYSVTVDDITDMSGGTLLPGFTKNYFGVNVGGGVTYEIASNWGLGFDVRLHHIFSNITTWSYADNGPVQIAANNITTLLKLQYNFSL